MPTGCVVRAFKLLTAVISPMGRPVAMRMRPKEVKNRRFMATTSRMRRRVPFEPIDPKLCFSGIVADKIKCANFFGNQSQGFGATGPPKWPFSLKTFIVLTTV